MLPHVLGMCMCILGLGELIDLQNKFKWHPNSLCMLVLFLMSIFWSANGQSQFFFWTCLLKQYMVNYQTISICVQATINLERRAPLAHRPCGWVWILYSVFSNQFHLLGEDLLKMIMTILKKRKQKNVDSDHTKHNYPSWYPIDRQWLIHFSW